MGHRTRSCLYRLTYLHPLKSKHPESHNAPWVLCNHYCLDFYAVQAVQKCAQHNIFAPEVFIMRKLLSTFLVLAIIFLVIFWGDPNIPIDWDNLLPDITISDAIGNINDVVNSVLPSYTLPNISIPENSSFSVHFIDVGQADAALILCDGEALLIDGGNRADSDLLYSYLQDYGISHLSAVIGTHGHEDHIGGIAGALQYATVDTVYCSVTSYNSKAFSNFVSAAQNRGAELTVPKSGDTFTLGSAVCQFLGPITLDPDEPNNTSLVVKIVYGNTSFLFTGDAELSEETQILDAGYDISCDVLKVGHHGSSSSTGYRWLRDANPTYAVISCGSGNDYGHPHDAVLSRLSDAEVKTYRTDLQGHIICTSDGNDITFQVTKKPDANTLG